MAGEEVRRAQARARRASEAMAGIWAFILGPVGATKGTQAKEGQDLIVPRQHLPDYWLENKPWRDKDGCRETVKGSVHSSEDNGGLDQGGGSGYREKWSDSDHDQDLLTERM